MADSIYEVVGGGVTIGNAVSGGTANTILFSDASTNLADSTDLFWDDVLKIFHVGDFGLAANSTFMSLDDQNSLITNQTDGVFKVVNSSGDRLILVDVVNGDYGIGDIDGILNSTRFVIDDTTKAASIAAGGDRMRLDINGTAFTSKLGDTGAVGNSTILVVDDATANKKVTSSGTVITVGALNSSNAPTSDPITISGTFTGSATTTYTVTVAGSAVDFNWTDGTNSGTNVPMNFGSPTLLSNGISVTFDGFSYTPTEYWTQAYTASVVQRFLLDYKNDTYQMGNLGSSGPRAKLYADSTLAKLSYLDTGIVSEIRTKDTQVEFIYATSAYSTTFAGASNQINMTVVNNSNFNAGVILNTSSASSLYFQNGSTFSYWGVKAENNIVTVGDFAGTQNNTIIIVNDTATTIKLAGGVINNYTAQTGTYAILRNDYLIDCTSGTFTATLPTAVGFGGQTYVIKNSGAGVITLATTSSQTIDGVTTQTLTTMLSITVISDGANWIIV